MVEADVTERDEQGLGFLLGRISIDFSALD